MNQHTVLQKNKRYPNPVLALQVILVIIFLTVSITTIRAVYYSRFSSPIADILCIAGIFTLVFLPLGVSGHAKAINESFPLTCEAIAFFGTPILLLISGIVRVLQKNSERARRFNWMSFWLSLGLMYGFYFILMSIGYGDGA